MKLNRKTVVPGCGLLVFLAASFGPVLVTTSWHLRHGNSIVTGGRIFHVPLGWYAKAEGNHITISKFSSTVYSKHLARAFIFFSPVQLPPKTEPEKELAYQSFSSVYWTYLAGGLGETKGPIRRGIGGNEQICMETTVVKDKWVAVSCLSYRGTWDADFYGEPSQLDSFYRISDASVDLTRK